MSEAAFPVGSFPERVGKYELLLPLGTGGTATVYLARSRGVAGFEREVALKLVHAHLRSDEESRLHLLEEARLAARIRHPNVVPVTEVDSDSCGVFLVMDYVEGESLSGLVRLLRDQDKRMPPRLTARIINDALAGLHAAHELTSTSGEPLELVHRDFSPQNILVGVEGVARLADFGVAKAASRTVRTKTGLVKGKIAYMSPEQARGYPVDRRCDVWAAGVVIWELVTGRKLYDHDDDVATLLSVVTEIPPRLSDVMAGIPTTLDDAVASALECKVDERCPSAEALRRALETAWESAGGMATPSELGEFVKETVAEKLAERRAKVANQAPPQQTTNSARNRSSPHSAAGLLSDSLPAEEGTKTAISAAVPSAEQLGFGRQRRISRRVLVGATAALLLAVGTLTLIAPEGSATGPVLETPEPALLAPVAASIQPAEEISSGEQTAVLQGDTAPDSPRSDPSPDKSGTRAPQAPEKKALGKKTKRKKVARQKRRKKKKTRSQRRRASARKARPRSAPLQRKTKTPANESKPRNSLATKTRPQVSKKKSSRRKGPPPLLLAPDPYQKSKK